MKYSTHKEKWQGCTRCELASQRGRMVFARGKVPCDILFIGEAPGQSENVLGKPFVGPAGKVLDRIIEIAVDGQLDYLITNLVCCFPKDAKNTDNHEPPEKAIKACFPRLAELVELARPTAVITVGALADKWVFAGALPPRMLNNLMFASIPHPARILRLDVSQQGFVMQKAIITVEELVANVIEIYKDRDDEKEV